jgi:hypothetical protein
MNNNFILKEDGKIYHVEMPDSNYDFNCTVCDDWSKADKEVACKCLSDYRQALQSAISNAVEVSNFDETEDALLDTYGTHHGFSLTKNHVYSLQCSVRKYYTAKSDNRTIEEMMAGVTLTEKPLTDGVLKSVLVTFPESGNKTEQEQEQTADQMLAAAVKRHNTNGFPATTYEEDYAGGSEMYVQESIALDAIRQLQQQVNSLREQMATHDKCDEIDWNWNPKTVALKEENERLKADIKTIGQILKDGGWIDLFEKIIALNPTPKTEGTSI